MVTDFHTALLVGIRSYRQQILLQLASRLFFSFNRHLAASVSKILVNGQQVLSNTPTAAGFDGENISLVFGANYVSGTTYQTFFNGKVSEIIMFNCNLKNSEIESVDDYLSQKYIIK